MAWGGGRMSIRLAAVLAAVAGAVAAVFMLLGDRTLQPRQLAHAKAACRQCHAKPAYAGAGDVHPRHPRLDCDTCHPVGPPAVDFAACASCHGTPRYQSAPALHEIHAALGCSRCHGDHAGLKTADRLHAGLIRVGLGMAVLALAGTAAGISRARKRDTTG
jgi:hypothetical protein